MKVDIAKYGNFTGLSSLCYFRKTNKIICSFDGLNGKNLLIQSVKTEHFCRSLLIKVPPTLPWQCSVLVFERTHVRHVLFPCSLEDSSNLTLGSIQDQPKVLHYSFQLLERKFVHSKFSPKPMSHPPWFDFQQHRR
eukprot:GFKZ01010779.1.p1 GENE.GFKZ01010779.1~~GFKZ01010779.1.p1  ORF type:complete len:136 (+),score=3.98 GFKZ01010779.1:627-1034(+)